MNKLATYFAALVRAEFDAATLAEVLRLNATSAYAASCATHDFIDANCLMYGAFCALHFREPDSGSDEDTAEINAAWDQAKAARFGVTA